MWPALCYVANEMSDIINAAPSIYEGPRYAAAERAANRNRDTRNDGSCSVCEAPLGHWCDDVVHAQVTAAAASAIAL